MSSLAGKVIIITGAGRGLGRGMAERCGREGAHIAILEIDVDLGRTSAAALTESGVEALFVEADIAQASQVENAVAQVIERWGRVDGLVNNAALAMGLGGQPFEVIAEDEWERVMTVNVKGLWLVCRAVAPHMRAAGHGKIVNIASDVPLWGGDLYLHYVASKGAVVAMTRSLARELGEDNVCVNAIAPGLHHTEATKQATERRWNQYAAGQVLKREAMPDDIVGAAVFLLSGDSDFVTGQVLAVDGGMVMG